MTGKYRPESGEVDSQRAKGAQRYFSEGNWELLDKMDEMGREKGEKSISQIALAWMLSNPLITSPIIGPRSMDQLADNLGSAGLRLTEGELQILNTASQPKNNSS